MAADPTAPCHRLVLEVDEALNGPLSDHVDAVRSRERRVDQWRGTVTERQSPSQAWRLLHSEGGLPQPPGLWVTDAACRGLNHKMVLPLNITYTARYQRYAGVVAQVAEAKAICAECPVLAECRIWALTTPDPAIDHVAGALTPWERRTIRKQRLKVIP